MVTTKYKPILDTQKIKTKASKHTNIKNYQITEEEIKKGKTKQRHYKTI